MSTSEIMFGGPVNRELVTKVRKRMQGDFKGKMSNLALMRILLGLYADGLITVEHRDIFKYSPQSFMGAKYEVPE